MTRDAIAPEFPAGPAPSEPPRTDAARSACVATLEQGPAALRAVVARLGEHRLDTRYRNWTARQIVHHVADSHANAYLRFKLALAEHLPTIRPYNQGDWAELADARTAPVAAPVALIEGVHASWVALLTRMTAPEFDRVFYHPEYNEQVSLASALAYYTWHTRHHTAQLAWIIDSRG